MKKRRSVGSSFRFDFRIVMATFCFAIFTFCMLKYFEPVQAIEYDISGSLSVPQIGLYTDVTTLKLEKGKLNTPNTIAGSFTRYEGRTLLIGHSSTVFKVLDDIQIGQEVDYNDSSYIVEKIELLEKQDIDMDKLLLPDDKNSLVLMTCAGELYANGDASHRLIIFAYRV